MSELDSNIVIVPYTNPTSAYRETTKLANKAADNPALAMWQGQVQKTTTGLGHAAPATNAASAVAYHSAIAHEISGGTGQWGLRVYDPVGSLLRRHR